MFLCRYFRSFVSHCFFILFYFFFFFIFNFLFLVIYLNILFYDILLLPVLRPNFPLSPSLSPILSSFFPLHSPYFLSSSLSLHLPSSSSLPYVFNLPLSPFLLFSTSLFRSLSHFLHSPFYLFHPLHHSLFSLRSFNSPVIFFSIHLHLSLQLFPLSFLIPLHHHFFSFLLYFQLSFLIFSSLLLLSFLPFSSFFFLFLSSLLAWCPCTAAMLSSCCLPCILYLVVFPVHLS